MKQIISMATILFSLCFSSWGQEIRHEITVQGSGFFTKQTDGSGISNRPTYSGGVLAGYRYNINRWLSAEADYDYFSNAQRFFSPGGFSQLQNNVHAVTGVAVVRLPIVFRLAPYVLGGGGGIFFNPRDIASLDTQAQGTFVYGGGFDVAVVRHIDLRVQYRGFVYKVPDFDTPTLHVDNFTHSAVPSAGFVFKF
jgi:outer membrane immunogenic protein